uniref:Uncharacterized protein n=1 Tax=Anguilla anguilla TaxID=7936 RepID=A0A0E9QM59_ANGAN
MAAARNPKLNIPAKPANNNHSSEINFIFNVCLTIQNSGVKISSH